MAEKDDYTYITARVKTPEALRLKEIAAASGIRDTHFMGLALVVGVRALADQLGVDTSTLPGFPVNLSRS